MSILPSGEHEETCRSVSQIIVVLLKWKEGFDRINQQRLDGYLFAIFRWFHPTHETLYYSTIPLPIEIKFNFA
jgi:hypothetical protein